MNFSHLCFCFGVWGDDPKYTLGIWHALVSVNKFFPGAKFKVIYEDAAPLTVPDQGCWRLTVPAGASSNTTHFLFRDADSRVTLREYFAVIEWLASGEPFHFMRDHPHHHAPVMGGMWGYRAHCQFSLTERLAEWIKRSGNQTAAGYGVNQRFLAEEVWPYAKDRCLEHGSFNSDKFPNQIPFPTDRFNVLTEGFVGERVLADGTFCQSDRDARKI